MTILFWDIDGTLLTTNRAGITAWEGALAGVIGRPTSLETLHTAGLTDVEIARLLLELEGEDVGRAPEVLRGYEDRLPAALCTRAGRVLPQVLEVLWALERSRDVRMLLLTGNSRRGAAAKLGHYGLSRFFPRGAFGDDAADRPGVARAALALAERSFGAVDLDRAFVIGDTPADVQCGQCIGARTVAVATGVYGAGELGRANPTITLSELPPPEIFARTLSLSP